MVREMITEKSKKVSDMQRIYYCIHLELHDNPGHVVQIIFK